MKRLFIERVKAWKVKLPMSANCPSHFTPSCSYRVLSRLFYSVTSWPKIELRYYLKLGTFWPLKCYNCVTKHTVFRACGHKHNCWGAVLSSQVFFTPAQSSAEKPLLPDTSTANNTDYETAVSLSEQETAVPCLPLQEQSLEERKEREEERKEARKEESAVKRKELILERKTGYHTETTSESEACVVRSEGCHSNPEQSEKRARNTLSLQERGSFCGCHEPRSSNLRKPHAGMKSHANTDLHAKPQPQTHQYHTRWCAVWVTEASWFHMITNTPFLYVVDVALWWDSCKVCYVKGTHSTDCALA